MFYCVLVRVMYMYVGCLIVVINDDNTRYRLHKTVPLTHVVYAYIRRPTRRLYLIKSRSHYTHGSARPCAVWTAFTLAACSRKRKATVLCLSHLFLTLRRYDQFAVSHCPRDDYADTLVYDLWDVLRSPHRVFFWCTCSQLATCMWAVYYVELLLLFTYGVTCCICLLHWIIAWLLS